MVPIFPIKKSLLRNMATDETTTYHLTFPGLAQLSFLKWPIPIFFSRPRLQFRLGHNAHTDLRPNRNPSIDKNQPVFSLPTKQKPFLGTKNPAGSMSKKKNPAGTWNPDPSPDCNLLRRDHCTTKWVAGAVQLQQCCASPLPRRKTSGPHHRPPQRKSPCRHQARGAVASPS